MRPLAWSLAACAVSIALETVLAGSGIRQRLATVRMPRFSPPFWGWVAIGLCYYLILLVILFRLFFLPAAAPGRSLGLALAGGMMFVNALWNYFFFRSRNLLHAWLLGLPYGLIAIALLVVLHGLDRTAALALWPVRPLSLLCRLLWLPRMEAKS